MVFLNYPVASNTQVTYTQVIKRNFQKLHYKKYDIRREHYNSMNVVYLIIFENYLEQYVSSATEVTLRPRKTYVKWQDTLIVSVTQ